MKASEIDSRARTAPRGRARVGQLGEQRVRVGLKPHGLVAGRGLGSVIAWPGAPLPGARGGPPRGERTALAAAQRVEALVGGDPVKPGAQRGPSSNWPSRARRRPGSPAARLPRPGRSQACGSSARATRAGTARRPAERFTVTRWARQAAPRQPALDRSPLPAPPGTSLLKENNRRLAKISGPDDHFCGGACLSYW